MMAEEEQGVIDFVIGLNIIAHGFLIYGDVHAQLHWLVFPKPRLGSLVWLRRGQITLNQDSIRNVEKRGCQGSWSILPNDMHILGGQ